MVHYEYKESLLRKLQYDEFILMKVIEKNANNPKLVTVVEAALKELNLTMAKIIEIEQDLAVDNGVMR